MNNQIYPEKEVANSDGYGLKAQFDFNVNAESRFTSNNALIAAWGGHFSDHLNSSQGSAITASHPGESDAMREFTDSSNLCFKLIFKRTSIVDYAFWVDLLKNGSEVAKITLEIYNHNPHMPLGQYKYENVKVCGLSALDLTNTRTNQDPYYTVSFSATKLTFADGQGTDLTTITAARHAGILKG